jgi:glucose/arabinose dehydrogenase
MPRSAPAPAGRLRTALVAGALLVALAPGQAAASTRPAPIVDGSVAPALSAADITLAPIATGLDRPVFITSARDGSGRTFIVEQGGRILVRKDGVILPTPLLDITGLVSTGGEQGLLGLAFHPDFERNRRFYVNYTNRDGDTIVRRYRTSSTNPDRTEAGSAKTIIKIAQPYANHNGGMLAFGPGGYLYIGMGDGGGADDPGNRAQNTGSLLGKMLRIDVNGTTSTHNYRVPSSNPYVGRTGRNEIWQLGLRNPWRFSFDRKTGAMGIGDVRHAAYEEIDRAIHTDTGSGRGFNWGWRVMEGRHCHIPSSGCNRTGKKLPIIEYTQASNGRCAVTGGYVYRGSRIPALVGFYVYGDFCSGEIWAIKANSSYPPTRITLAGPGSGRRISSFGESPGGELYVVDLGGTISVIRPA